MNSIPEIHVGAIIKKYIDSNRIYKSALARKMQRDDSAILRYQKSAGLQTTVLLTICHALKHNFFADIAMQLPPTYSVTAPSDTSKDERIAQLEQENAILKAEKQVLIEVAKG